MDEQIQFNRDRWSALVDANIVWSRPHDALDADGARAKLAEGNRLNMLGMSDFNGKDVLCLASGGGQQSVIFGLLGANVTVLDITPGQLAKDQAMADKYGFKLTLIEHTMTDLSMLADASFDLVWQPYAINFVPDPLPVIQEVSRVLRSDGRYYLQFANPAWTMDEGHWTGTGYPMLSAQKQGNSLSSVDPYWEMEDGSKVLGPTEWLHTFGTLVNGLGQNGLLVYAMYEGPPGDAGAEPGSWEHLKAWMPLWPAFFAKKMN